MLKHKATLAIAGLTALVGVVGGTALMASAQSAPMNTNAPVTLSNSTSVGSATVDTPESANDPVDTGALQSTSVSATDPVDQPDVSGQKATTDTDGSAASESTESGSTSDASDQ